MSSQVLKSVSPATEMTGWVFKSASLVNNVEILSLTLCKRVRDARKEEEKEEEVVS
ncbi:hypothetical protein E2C01_023677 [Portunus trituberculatus]|uniref:Uncharacterized protein n=1 Tax=Portunus trituberculatus TaxID=210409 RepID=A0A5B7EBR8_PORTR|nr:hypothetical protein [Portunus trituberculatus]